MKTKIKLIIAHIVMSLPAAVSILYRVWYIVFRA
jgi:hypothetical protein